MEANYLGLISLLFLYRNAKGNMGIYIKHKLFIQSNLVLTVLLFLSFAVVTLNRRDYLTCILYVATTFLPTLIVNVDWNNTETFEKCCRVWAKGIRICCTVMFLGGTLDVFTNNSVSNFLQILITLHRLFIMQRQEELFLIWGMLYLPVNCFN